MRKAVLLATCLAGAVLAPAAVMAQAPAPEGAIRIATYNASLNRSAAGALIADLSGDNAQAKKVAEIIQRVDPDVILINEFDYDDAGEAARLFVERYLAVGQNGAAAWHPVAWFSAPSNTGIPSGIDFNRDGNPAGPDDAYGFGFYPGQYGMLVLSKLPIDDAGVRTFQSFRWQDMPGARLPDDPATPAVGDYYGADALAVFRLSSKSHWDVPVLVGGEAIHILASHPTPPVFDGPEDRNGTRNADEIRLWQDYITPGAGGYLYDDSGVAGGLAEGSHFVIVGDQNVDPNDGDGMRPVIAALLASPLVTDPMPVSAGGPEDAVADGGRNTTHTGDPANDTSDFADANPTDAGNLRADYALPSATLEVVGSGIFWPVTTDPLASLLMNGSFQTSDHRLVWVDVEIE